MRHFSKLLFLLIFVSPDTIFAQNIDNIIKDPSRNLNVIRQKAEAFFQNKSKVGTGWKDWKRFEDIMRSRTLRDGTLVDLDSADRAALAQWKTREPVDNIYNKTQTGIASWLTLGQANPTIPAGRNQNGVGSIRCMERVGTSDPADYWIGGAGGGMWYGNYVSGSNYNWSPRTDGIPNLAITDIEICPTNTNRIYALTGAVGSASGYRSTGVLTSTDAGTTWALTGLNFSGSGNVKGYKLLASSTTSTTCWAATDNGLYRTTDGGATWDLTTFNETGIIGSSDMNMTIYDIVYKPGSTTTLYAVGNDWFGISTNGGANFEHKSNATVGLNSSGSNRLTLGVSPANSSAIYIMYSDLNTSAYRAIYLSTNSGSSFTEKSDVNTYPNLLGSQSWRNCALAVSPGNYKDLWVGGLDIYESQDYGVTWTLKSDQSTTNAGFFAHADIFTLEATSTYLYACTDGGIYRMTRSTDVWVDLNDRMQIAQVYRLAVDPTAAAGFVVLGTQDNGTYRNTGAQYKSIGGADGMECLVKPTDVNVIYLCSQNGGINIRDDAANTNTAIFNSSTADAICVGCNDGGAWTTPIVLRPGNPTHIYVGYSRIYFNTNQGAGGSGAWTMISTGFSSAIQSMEFAPGQNTVLYATNGSQIRRFNFASGSWNSGTNIYGNLPASTAIAELAVDPNDATHVVIGVDGYTDGRKVFETFNADAASPTWVNISRNLPNTPVNCIIMDDDANNTIYIGTDIGVFVTNDNRVNWIWYNSGLPTTRVYDLELNTAASPDLIFAATYGRGIFKAETYTGCAASATLSGTIEGLHYTEASSSITSTQFIWGGEGTSVGYNSDDSITLKPGFEVKAGSKFEAYIQGCTSSGQSPRPLKQVKPTKPNTELKLETEPKNEER